MSRNRYGAWDGGPDPLAPPYDVRAAVDEVGKDVLAGRSLREALRDLLRRGPNGRGGLDDLEARARRMRREAMRRGNLDGAVTRAQQLLDQAIAAERDELSRRDDMDTLVRTVQIGQPAAIDREGGRGAVRLPVGQRRGPAALPADPRRAPAGGRRPAVPRPEGRAVRSGRTTGRRRDDARPQRAAGTACPRRGHDRSVRRVHEQARRLLPGESADRRRADRRARPAGGGRRAADALAVAAAAG